MQIADTTTLHGGLSGQLVLRCQISTQAETAPATVILKRASMAEYQPDSADSRPAWGLFNEWAGLSFLQEMGFNPELTPHIYGGNRQLGFVIIEDLEQPASLTDYLMANDPLAARERLIQAARSLGQLHARTIGAADRFKAMRDNFGPQNPRFFGIVSMTPPTADNFKDLRDTLMTTLKVALQPSYLSELQRIAETIANPTPFWGYTHGDPAPDNCLFIGDDPKWIDLEFGGYGAILIEGLYWRMQCMNRLPASVLQAVERTYRLELSTQLSAAKDEAAFGKAIVAVGIAWIWNTLTTHLKLALEQDYAWPFGTRRQRILARMEAYLDLTSLYLDFPQTRHFVGTLYVTLSERWQDLPSLPFYPAFRG